MTQTNFNPRTLIVASLAALLAGCTSLGAAGPSVGQIQRIDSTDYAGSKIALVDLNPASRQRVSAYERSLGLAERLGEGSVTAWLIGPGDTLDISLWEAPPAVLFGGGGVVPGLDAGAQNRAVVQQMVDAAGTITVPFAGSITVGGHTPAEVERMIVARLQGRANNPQASVRLALNDSRNVTVLGEVAASRRVPLGPRGERLLDVIASAGDARTCAPGHRAGQPQRLLGDDASRGDHCRSSAEHPYAPRGRGNGPAPAFQLHCAGRGCSKRRDPF